MNCIVYYLINFFLLQLEMQIRKAEEELERTETKYHLSTRNVELLRQECDAEMYRVNI